jgi:hypothetical protein
MPFAAVQTFPKNALGSTSDLAGGQHPPAAHIRLLAFIHQSIKIPVSRSRRSRELKALPKKPWPPFSHAALLRRYYSKLPGTLQPAG